MSADKFMAIQIKSAVECKQCNKLIDADKTYIVVKQMNVDLYTKPQRITTKISEVDEVFCDARCLTEFIQKQLEEF